MNLIKNVNNSPKQPIQFSMFSLVFFLTASALFAGLISRYGMEPILPWACLFLIGCILAVIGRWMVVSAIAAEKNDPSSPRKLETFNDNLQASVLVGMLEEAGINATAVGGFVSGFQAESPGYVDVVVAASDFTRAQTLVNRWKRKQPIAPNAESIRP